MSGGKTGDSVAAPVEAELERNEQLHAELKARIEELRDDAENAEARQLRELEPKLAAHNGELRNTIAVLRLIEHQIALEHYVRIDGYAPLITRILGFVAMAEERSRQEMMATFTEQGEKRYTIEDAVMQLCRRGLLKRTDVGKVEAVQERAWEAIERGESGLTHQILTMIEAGRGPCSRHLLAAVGRLSVVVSANAASSSRPLHSAAAPSCSRSLSSYSLGRRSAVSSAWLLVTPVTTRCLVFQITGGTRGPPLAFTLRSSAHRSSSFVLSATRIASRVGRGPMIADRLYLAGSGAGVKILTCTNFGTVS